MNGSVDFDSATGAAVVVGAEVTVVGVTGPVVGVVGVVGAGVVGVAVTVVVVAATGVVGVVVAAGGTVDVGGVTTLQVCGLYCWQVEPPPDASATLAATRSPTAAARMAIAVVRRPRPNRLYKSRLPLENIFAPLIAYVLARNSTRNKERFDEIDGFCGFCRTSVRFLPVAGATGDSAWPVFPARQPTSTSIRSAATGASGCRV